MTRALSPSTLWPMTSLLMLAATSAALAAEVTDLPPQLRGNVTIAYTPVIQTGSLIEDDVSVGRMTTEDHVLRIGGAFAPAPGVAIWFQAPIYLSSRIGFTDTREMAYDPTIAQGSLAYGDETDADPFRAGSGVGGLWLGARGTPFSEEFVGRGNRATWLIDVGVRTKDETNIYSADPATDPPTRGGGPGAGAFMLRNGFSTTRGISQPYLQVTWLRQGVIPTSLYDGAGAVVTADAAVAPADVVDIRGGVQVRVAENEVNSSSLDLDFRLGFDYNSPGQIPSGLYLPSVLPVTTGILVDTGEYSSAGVGFGMYWRMFKYLKLDIVTDVSYVMPRQLEQPYPVYTGPDTLVISGQARLNVLVY